MPQPTRLAPPQPQPPAGRRRQRQEQERRRRLRRRKELEWKSGGGCRDGWVARAAGWLAGWMVEWFSAMGGLSAHDAIVETLACRELARHNATLEACHAHAAEASRLYALDRRYASECKELQAEIAAETDSYIRHNLKTHWQRLLVIRNSISNAITEHNVLLAKLHSSLTGADGPAIDGLSHATYNIVGETPLVLPDVPSTAIVAPPPAQRLSQPSRQLSQPSQPLQSQSSQPSQPQRLVDVTAEDDIREERRRWYHDLTAAAVAVE